jgi:hypothetical protein
MPKPSKVLGDGQLEFQKPLTYEVCGGFFKYITKPDLAKKQSRKYPVILAWQLTTGQAPAGPGSSLIGPMRSGIMLLAVVLGVALFVFLKRKLKKSSSHRAGAFGKYRPLRHETPAGAARADGLGEIDHDLARAVDEYRKQQELKP